MSNTPDFLGGGHELNNRLMRKVPLHLRSQSCDPPHYGAIPAIIGGTAFGATETGQQAFGSANRNEPYAERMVNDD
jgi:hypothetical protein